MRWHEQTTDQGITFSDDPARVDHDWLHAALAERSYWVPDIPRAVMVRALASSLVVGAYRGDVAIGFARVVTDRATFAYLCDVFVDESVRGQGVGQALVAFTMAHPSLAHLRRTLLATKDAHGLYAQHGFTPLSAPARFMERYVPDAYLAQAAADATPAFDAHAAIADAIAAQATTIDLAGQALREIPASIGDATSLRQLFAHRNRLVALPDRIGDLAQLDLLDLSDNGLRSWPESIGRLVSLRLLYCSNTRLAALPASLTRLSRLEYLNVGGNRITALPDDIGALAALVELRADDNAIAALPSSIGDLAHLRELHLRGNRLTALPSSIGGLRKLRELHLRGNALSTLPETIGDLAALTTLDLRGNALEALPDTMSRLHELRVLDLRSNALRDFPRAIANLPNLHRLDLRWNPLPSPPPWIDALAARGCTIWW